MEAIIGGILGFGMIATFGVVLFMFTSYLVK